MRDEVRDWFRRSGEGVVAKPPSLGLGAAQSAGEDATWNTIARTLYAYLAGAAGILAHADRVREDRAFRSTLVKEAERMEASAREICHWLAANQCSAEVAQPVIAAAMSLCASVRESTVSMLLPSGQAARSARSQGATAAAAEKRSRHAPMLDLMREYQKKFAAGRTKLSFHAAALQVAASDGAKKVDARGVPTGQYYSARTIERLARGAGVYW